MLHLTTATADTQSPLPIRQYDNSCSCRGTILVVEDEAFVRDAACDILAAGGYQVRCWWSPPGRLVPLPAPR